jgi:hypothetical protein
MNVSYMDLALCVYVGVPQYKLTFATLHRLILRLCQLLACGIKASVYALALIDLWSANAM